MTLFPASFTGRQNGMSRRCSARDPREKACLYACFFRKTFLSSLSSSPRSPRSVSRTDNVGTNGWQWRHGARGQQRDRHACKVVRRNAISARGMIGIHRTRSPVNRRPSWCRRWRTELDNSLNNNSTESANASRSALVNRQSYRDQHDDPPSCPVSPPYKVDGRKTR